MRSRPLSSGNKPTTFFGTSQGGGSHRGSASQGRRQLRQRPGSAGGSATPQRVAGLPLRLSTGRARVTFSPGSAAPPAQAVHLLRADKPTTFFGTFRPRGEGGLPQGRGSDWGLQQGLALRRVGSAGDSTGSRALLGFLPEHSAPRRVAGTGNQPRSSSGLCDLRGAMK